MWGLHTRVGRLELRQLVPRGAQRTLQAGHAPLAQLAPQLLVLLLSSPREMQHGMMSMCDADAVMLASTVSSVQQDQLRQQDWPSMRCREAHAVLPTLALNPGCTCIARLFVMSMRALSPP